MVEAAFVTPVFFLLIFAIIEFGLLYRDYLTVSNAASQGARTASVSGDDVSADFFVLQSVNHGLAAANLQDLESIVIFEALSPSDSPPPACLGPTGTNQVSTTHTGGNQRGCNVYFAADLFKGIIDAGGNPTKFFTCTEVEAIDDGWCPVNRKTTLIDSGPTQNGPDYVGVYVAIEHQMVTGFFGSTRTLTDTKIIRIEPERQQ